MGQRSSQVKSDYESGVSFSLEIFTDLRGWWLMLMRLRPLRLLVMVSGWGRSLAYFLPYLDWVARRRSERQVIFISAILDSCGAIQSFRLTPALRIREASWVSTDGSSRPLRAPRLRVQPTFPQTSEVLWSQQWDSSFWMPLMLNELPFCRPYESLQDLPSLMMSAAWFISFTQIFLANKDPRPSNSI